MSFWSGLTRLIADHGVLTVAFIVLIRSAGVPIPVPADLLVVLVGVQAEETHASLWPAWLLYSVATTIGAGCLYAFTRWVGQDDIIHYGHYVGITPSRLDSAEGRLRARGWRAILAARVIPGLRLASVVACGILRIPEVQFFPAVIVGALIYVGACLLLGVSLGSQALDAIGQLAFNLGLLESLVGLSAVLLWLSRARRRVAPSAARLPLSRSRRWQAGAISGALAVFGSSMAVNALLYVGGPIILELVPGRADVESLVAELGGLIAIVGSFLEIVFLGIVWGAVFAHLEGYSWGSSRDWLRGLIFSVVPFGVASFPRLLDALISDQQSELFVLSAIGEALRWSLYGVLLGLIYPVFRARKTLARSG